MIDQEVQQLLDEKQDEILTGMPVPQDGKIGDIRTNITHKGKFYQTMKVGIDTHFFSAPFSRVPSIHTMDDYLLKSGGKMLDNTLLDAYDVTIRNDLLLSGPTAGTDNTVLVLNSTDDMVVTDEIDAKVWAGALVDYTGSPADNQIATFTDVDTIKGESKLTFDGTTLLNAMTGDGYGFQITHGGGAHTSGIYNDESDGTELVLRDVAGNIDVRLSTNAGVDSYINNDGNVGINIAAPLAKLHIDQATDDAAIPVLILDQADISEGFINFIGSDRGVITGATDSLESVRVEIGGVVRRIALYVDA